MGTGANGGGGVSRFFRAVLRPRPAALPLSIREAWLAHERYAGRRVALAGVVRVFEADTPGEYFTLDEGQSRVGLRADPAHLRAQVGRRVRATGQLTFKPGVGIFLNAERVEARNRRP